MKDLCIEMTLKTISKTKPLGFFESQLELSDAMANGKLFFGSCMSTTDVREHPFERIAEISSPLLS
jgi:hypothetical protein